MKTLKYFLSIPFIDLEPIIGQSGLDVNSQIINIFYFTWFRLLT